MTKHFIYLFLLISVTLVAQTPATVLKEGNYTISNGTTNLTATQSITLKPNVWIKSGSIFSARILRSSDETTATDPYTVFTFSNENYVFTRTYQTAMTSFNASTAKEGDVIESISYFDGLGRPKQSIAIKGSPTKKDIITHIGYDAYGRQDKDWLPYMEGTGTSGSYRGDVSIATQNYYKNAYGSDFPGLSGVNVNAYSEKLLESSPLSRVLKQAAPGQDWSLGRGNEIEFDYHTNIANEVLKFEIDDVNQIVESKGYFAENTLYKTITKNENHKGGEKKNTIEEFKDGKGRVILQRTYADYNGEVDSYFDTYYVYDYKDNLRYVITPKAIDIISSQIGSGTGEYLVNFYHNLFTDVNGGGGIKVSISGKQLTVNFSAGFVSTQLNETPRDIGAKCTLPDMFLGYVPVKPAYSGNSYSASIVDGKLKITNHFGHIVSGFQGTLSKTLTENCGGENLTLNTNLLNELCYQYKYDDKNRLIEKQIPGKGREYIVYNTLDQPILTQDAIQNAKPTPEWLFTKYDAFGRVVYTGLVTGGTRTSHQSAANAATKQYETALSAPATYAGTSVYYSKNTYPTSFTKVYTINYYDNYNFMGTSSFANSSYQTTIEKEALKLKGLSTGTKVRVLGTNQWITTIVGYDEKGRAIYTQSTNDYLGTTDIVENKLDFAGKAERVKTTHIKEASTPIITEDVFTYDHMGRLLTQKQTIGSHTEEIVSNVYDNLGQLKTKEVGGGLQTVDYAYNVRGWLKSINQDANTADNDLFNFVLRYNTPTTGTALFNGNISQTSWNTLNKDSSTKTYTYAYDALNRITGAIGNTSNYDVTGIDYDKNGNIQHLKRRGNDAVSPTSTNYGLIDNLDYQYGQGNKLLSVTDTQTGVFGNQGFKDGNKGSNDYIYDVNGNMTSDANKGINAISYNHLSLPTSVSVGGVNTGTISYIYDATGAKLQKKVLKNGNTTTTDYAGNYMYENGSIKFFNHAEGYVNAENGSYEYVYQYKDHLGNVRLSYADSNNDDSIATSEIIEENNYYPFGLQHKGYNNVINGTENNYHTYNGKELEQELGLNWTDYGARRYDASLGRWMSTDPLADKYYKFSPYVYVGNSPTIAIDPDGKRILFVNGYWMNNWIGRNIIGSSSSGKNYWGRGFTGAAQRFFGDYSSVSDSNYIDGSSSFGGDSSGGDREKDGYAYAKENYTTLTEGLGEDETFKLVTHSEGGAYGAGVARYLIERGHTVESILHLSTDEGDEFDTPEEPDTYQLSLGGDWVTGNKEINNGVDIFGVVDQFESKSDKAKYAHGSTKSSSVFKSAKALLSAVLKGATGVNVTETKSGIKFEIIRDNNKKDDE